MSKLSLEENTERQELDDEDFDDGKKTVKTPTAAELAEKYSYKEVGEPIDLHIVLFQILKHKFSITNISN